MNSLFHKFIDICCYKPAFAVLLALFTLVSAQSLYCGPYVSIQKVDTDSNFPFIELFVHVQDASGTDPGTLDESSLLVYEDGFRVNYVQVKRHIEADNLLHFVIALQTGDSADSQKLLSTATMIVQALGDDEKAAIALFGDTSKIDSNFSSNKQLLLDSLKFPGTGNSKNLLYDSVFDSVEFLSRQVQARGVVVLLASSVDDGSSLTYEDILTYTKEKGVPVFVIASGKAAASQELKRIAKLSGGSFMVLDSGEKALAFYEKKVKNFNSSYRIRYQSMTKRDGKAHLVEVRLRYDSLRDRDIHEFTHKSSLFAEVPEASQIILVLLLTALLVVILLMTGILILRSGKRVAVQGTQPRNDVREARMLSPRNLKPHKGTAVEDETVSYLSEAPDEILYARSWLLYNDKTQNRRIPLTKDEVTIGSCADALILIRDTSVSPRHCCLRKVDGNYYLADMVSESGTWLNGRKVLRPKLLYDWDEIRVGNIQLIFRGSV